MAWPFKSFFRSFVASTRPGATPRGAGVLRRLLRGLPQGEAPASGDVSLAATPVERFTAHSFTNAQGSRDYKLYVPAPSTGLVERLAASPRPLIVMLHGCTQNPDDFAAGTRMNELADAHGVVVLYPAQRASANGSGCWNWFRDGDQHRDEGEPAILTGMVREVVQTRGLDPRRVYAAGLSAGGAMAATLAATYPDVYAAVAVHSGLPHGAAHDVMSAFAAMRQGPVGPRPPPPAGRLVPTMVLHGDADATVSPRNGQLIVDDLRAAAGEGASLASIEEPESPVRHATTVTRLTGANGASLAEHWLIHGAAHAWSGGSDRGTYTDARGPDASVELLRFFAAHRLPAP